MTEYILGELIGAVALITSSVITVSGLWLIARHRKNVIKLAKNVECYHEIENALIRDKLVNQEGIENPTFGQIRYTKGQIRLEIFGESSEKLMSKKEAIQLRKKYLG
jgi:hypothetical protein